MILIIILTVIKYSHTINDYSILLKHNIIIRSKFMPSPYVPKVGAVYNPKALQNLSLEQVLHRSIVDPAFSDKAVGSTSYNWRQDYKIQIKDMAQIKDTAVLKQIETFMDKVAATPEGRQHLRQAAAMQQYRVAARDFENDIQESRDRNEAWRKEYAQKVAAGMEVGKVPPTREQEESGYAMRPRPDPSGRIVIVDAPEHNSTPEFDNRTGRIPFNSKRPLGEYLGTDAQWHPATLETIIYHELGHAEDPIISFQNRAALDAINNQKMPDKLNMPDFIRKPEDHNIRNGAYFNLGHEAPAIYDTNVVTPGLPFLGEPRSLDHSATRHLEPPANTPSPVTLPKEATRNNTSFNLDPERMRQAVAVAEAKYGVPSAATGEDPNNPVALNTPTKSRGAGTVQV
jgi:hypothetical protein